MHHQQRASIDGSGKISSTCLSYTLQAGLGAQASVGNPTRLTARVHSSPLAVAAIITAGCTPPSNSLGDVDMDEEMERVVCSVVNTPVDPAMVDSEPSPPMSAISSLGLNLPGPLQSQQNRARQALFNPSTGSLLGKKHDKPQLSMQSGVVSANRRKRSFSGGRALSPPAPAPEVKISLPSPRQGEFTQHNLSDDTPNSEESNGLLSPPEESPVTSRSRSAYVGKAAAAITRSRRSASVGALPSLDQIRDWSLRRNGVNGECSDDGNDVDYRCAGSSTPPPPSVYLADNQNLSAPVIQVLGATPPKALQAIDRLQQIKIILQGTVRAAARQQAVSLPSSPVKGSFGCNTLPVYEAQERTHCARKMVSVLERRKSISLVR